MPISVLLQITIGYLWCHTLLQLAALNLIDFLSSPLSNKNYDFTKICYERHVVNGSLKIYVKVVGNKLGGGLAESELDYQLQCPFYAGIEHKKPRPLKVFQIFNFLGVWIDLSLTDQDAGYI